MATNQLLMLAEPVPLLSELSAPAVRRFLSLWSDYLIRNEGLAPVMPTLKNAISATCQRHLMLLREAANLVNSVENRTPPLDNASTAEFEDENSIPSSAPTIPGESRPRPVDWSSDVDIKAQLIKQFGPRSFSASLQIQSKVTMKSAAISNLAAMEYVEDWIEAMEWPSRDEGPCEVFPCWYQAANSVSRTPSQEPSLFRRSQDCLYHSGE